MVKVLPKKPFEEVKQINGQDSLTIIVPLYNEQDCLTALQAELTGFLQHSPLPTTVLFVNDGSTDNSQAIIEAICAVDNRFHFLQLHVNGGLSAALKAGIDYATSSLIGYIDADIQTSPEDFIELLKFIPEYDLVTGIRQKRNDNVIKRVSSQIANSVRRSLIHDGIEDTGCPLKIGKAVYFKRMPFFHGMHRFIPALIQMEGGKVKQVPVRHFPRYAGTAKYHLLNRLIGPFFDALAFRWMQHHHIRYEVDRQA